MNLVDNAIRYTPVRERVFQRFYRIDDSDSDGCGLGLSIVREFATALDAKVTLRTPSCGVGLAADVVFLPARSSRGMA